MINIRILDTRNRRDVDAWVAFPHRLYKNDPLWVPQMESEARAQLDREKFPYYRHSDADFLVAEKDGEVVGRIAVLENKRHNQVYQEPVGFFTLFETIDDFAVAQALFDAAYDWLRQRKLTTLIGPKGFLAADSRGMLVKGFERPPAIGIAYNPPFYHDFMERLGFELEANYWSGWIATDHPVDERIFRIAEKVQKRYGFEFRKLHSKDELRAVVPDIIQAYNAAFANNWRFLPILPDEGEVIAHSLLAIIPPELPSLIMKDGKVAGFILVYPDISDAIRRARGKIWPFGWFHLMRGAKHTEWLNLNGGGVLPQYQGRGVDAMLIAELVKTLRASPYKYAEIVQINENNEKMQREMAAFGITFDKRHRVFRRGV